ncbi:hypothetical protein PCE1_004475 [Barthelona sp. PCE]
MTKYKTALYITFFFISGIITMSTMKISANLKYVASGGIHFDKPWFFTLTMFMSQTVMGLFLKKSEKSEEFSLLLAPKKQKKQIPFSAYAFPAFLDLFSTTLADIGLLVFQIPATIVQILKGSSIIFTYILESILYKKLGLPRKSRRQLLAVVMAFISLASVGFSSVMASSSGGDSKKTDTFMVSVGILLVFISQIGHGTQVVYEGYLLKGADVTAQRVVFSEGVFGTAFMFFFFVPITQMLKGTVLGEDHIDTLTQLKHSPILVLLTVLYCIGCIGLNFFGLKIVIAFSPLFKTLFEGGRSFFLFLFNLFLHYVVSGKLGEKLCEWTWLEGAGFVLLLFSFHQYHKGTGETKDEEKQLEASV